MINNKIISKGAALFFTFILLILSALDADGQTNPNTISTENVVDLTHTLTEDFPYIPIPGITFSFKKTPIATIEKMGVAAFRWEIHEHIGTQIDAPSHFFADGLSLEQTFTKERWRIEVIIYNDKEMTEALFSFVGEGHYKLGEASMAASGATNAIFYFNKKSLTLLTADKAKISRFKFDECGLSRGVPKDVSANGCSNFTSIAVCGQEYDLVKIEENKLQLGARPADGVMCSEEKRPKSLGTAIVRIN